MMKHTSGRLTFQMPTTKEKEHCLAKEKGHRLFLVAEERGMEKGLLRRLRRQQLLLHLSSISTVTAPAPEAKSESE